MASPDRSTGGTLKRIYESGEWSDLTTSTATRDFRVHKNIVCPACPFFEAACEGGFREANTGVVKLPESAATVEGILRFIYSLPVAEVTVEHAAARNLSHFQECVALHVAADKYDLQRLRAITTRSITTHTLCMTTTTKIVVAGLYMYNQPSGTIDSSIMKCHALVTANNLRLIRKQEQMWQALMAHPEYLTATLDQVLETADMEAVEAMEFMEADEEQMQDVMRLASGLRELGFFTAGV